MAALHFSQKVHSYVQMNAGPSIARAAPHFSQLFRISKVICGCVRLTDRGGPLEGHNVLPLTRVRPSDDRYHRLGGAQVEHLVRDAPGDEDKVPGRGLPLVRPTRTVTTPHP